MILKKRPEYKSYKHRTQIEKLLGQYTGYMHLTVSTNFARRSSYALENFFKRFTEREHPDEFTRRDMLDYQLYRKREGVGATTINYELRIVQGFFKWMVNQELMTYNPCEGVKALRQKEPERHAFNPEDQIKLYETAAATGKPATILLVGLALSTGLRGETLAALDTRDFDHETLTIRIPGKKMKTGRNHAVPLREDLSELVKTLPPGKVFNGATGKTLSMRFSRVLQRAGLPTLGLRAARRAFATSLLRSGADLGIVQRLLAHSNIATTSRYIVPADEETVRQAWDKLPKPGPNPSKEEA